ncbi:Asp-tRNA(Asn)/Glu-tRNA(Gln) amidotransferase subunit GatB [Acetivibrio straminisolvens]|jgi:aspartyl-tRNA(Asn)/glutamyl-tRNA(Gln) amidotransferase subunit B|uniref:Aspartyl/glutamyl-tRNA(Asn/Gln) amidotransferase subunit B n=1 Tax=Acetivibrio straminisolvens JCM 21531 TaxID=1294263 RepID=W4V2P0_9FIRM|nr:Asp-tRNA(Asn)/Glu-tRNA(Gln) amidotransferase subunit GatB [Acetivibrio straminisolvens]GAE87456.1 aspartyl-tRNA(Asn) amidotransferase [Acetivibrio straminisolvens JCM 21531]
MEYEIIIGLEVHVELSTKSKIYCSCTTDFGGEANTHICPICTGMPGVLPVLNKKVVEYAVKAGLAANCSIAEYSKQDRKNYFYPDLPKAYQISQYDLPLCQNGYIDIEVEGGAKRIGITRIHIEEDAGKLMHDENETDTLIDYNRCGVPLIEIVTEPDMRSAQEARAFVESLRNILQYIDISDCKMQEGSLRVDVNLSVRPKGQKEFGTRTEMKNLNSLRSIVRAIESEAKRQIEVIESGGIIVQETRRWDDQKGISYSMRTKEEAHDYRYFPEPDLMPVVVDEKWKEEIKRSLPELPDARRKRYISGYGLPEYDASILTGSKALADFFENAAVKSNNPKAVSNFILGDVSRILNDKGMEAEDIPFPAEYLARLVKLVDMGTISTTIAKKVLEIMFEQEKDPEAIVKEEGLEVVSDEKALIEVVKKVISNNEKSVEDYRKGKDKAFGFLVGQAMKETKGKANPKLLNKLLKEELEKKNL